MTIITPQQMWENYNRLTPPSPTFLTGEDTDDVRMYLSGFTEGNSVVRVYARLLMPPKELLRADKKPPVLIVADAFDKAVDGDEFTPLLKLGYALLLVDYAGKSVDKTCYTLYPRNIDSFWETNPASVFAPTDDPKKSCWYYWTTCILHAVTFLEGYDRVDAQNIGMIGIKEGASLVFKVSTCLKLKAAMTFFGGDLIGGGDEYLSYKAALDSRAYSKNIFPVLINATTNQKNGAFDYLSELYAGCDAAYFSVFTSADSAVSDAQRNNIKIWFDYHFFGEGTLPPKPQLNVFTSEGALYAEVISDAETVKLSGGRNYAPQYRNWREVTYSSLSDGRRLAKIDVKDASLDILLFATFNYKNGFTISSPVVTKNPAKCGVKAVEYKNSRLLYQEDNGTDAWMAQNGGFFENKRPEFKEGPFGLCGITGDELITQKPGDCGFNAGKDSLLQLILYSPLQQEIEARVTILDDTFKEYICKRRIQCGNWVTVTLSEEDFKCLMGAPSFDKIVSLEVRGQQITINSIIWV